MAVLRAPSQHHCRDVIVFQTQPYSLFRWGRTPGLDGLTVGPVLHITYTVYVWESVLALCVLSVHTWLSSFNKVHKDPLNTQLFIRCTAPSWTCSMCQLTYNRGRSVMLMSFTFMFIRVNTTLTNITQTKWVFIKHSENFVPKQRSHICIHLHWICEVKGQAVWMFSSWIALFRKQEPVFENNCPCKGRSEAGSRSSKQDRSLLHRHISSSVGCCRFKSFLLICVSVRHLLVFHLKFTVWWIMFACSPCGLSLGSPASSLSPNTCTLTHYQLISGL